MSLRVLGLWENQKSPKTTNPSRDKFHSKCSFLQVCDLDFCSRCINKEVLVAQSCPTLWNSMDCSLPWDSPGKNTGVGCYALLQGIFLTQESNLVSCIAGRFFTIWATREALLGHIIPQISSTLKPLTSTLWYNWFQSIGELSKSKRRPHIHCGHPTQRVTAIIRIY